MTTETTKNSAVKALGISGLVCGIMTFVGSFIPCFGMFAIFLGALALLLCIIGLVIASKKGAPKGLLIAGLILSLIGCYVAYSQAAAFASLGEEMQQHMQEQEEILDKSMKELEELTNED